MEWSLTGFIYWWLVMSIVAMLLIFLRDDRDMIKSDLQRGFLKNFSMAIVHATLMCALLPLSIPFSLGRIISKWF